MTKALPLRSDIAEQYKWNEAAAFPSLADWHTEYAQIRAALPALADFQGRLGEPGSLLQWIQTTEAIQTRLGRIAAYALMASSVDVRDQQAATLYNQMQSLYSEFETASAFAAPEMLQIGWENLEPWLLQNPELAIYRHYFQNLYRQQAHVRSAEVEAILGMVSAPFEAVKNTASLLTNSELHFPDALTSNRERIPVAQSTLHALMNSPDREVRRSAWQGYADAYLDFKNTLANNYLTAVKQHVFLARVRHYPSALEAALAPYNIPAKVFHNLLESFQRHLPIWHRYWELRRRALGLKRLHPYDVWAPLTHDDPRIPYDQAAAEILTGMEALGADYVAILRRGLLEDRWVDVYPNQGKRQGAFSVRHFGSHPYIMMSYTDNLNSLSTLAHELGHSMHAYLTTQQQPRSYLNYSLFVAEVASNFNQALVRAHLLQSQPNPLFQIAVIEEAMSNFHRYFFQMPMLSRFELAVHQRVEAGQSLSADDLITLMSDFLLEGYGGAVEAEQERSGITWAQFGHLYVPFYTYQYATGLSGAHALAQRVLDDLPGAVEGYLGFLKAGNAGYPLDVLKAAGVDLTSPAAVEATFAVLEQYVSRLETLLDQVQAAQ